jgi:hypothetical protein
MSGGEPGDLPPHPRRDRGAGCGPVALRHSDQIDDNARGRTFCPIHERENLLDLGDGAVSPKTTSTATPSFSPLPSGYGLGVLELLALAPKKNGNER